MPQRPITEILNALGRGEDSALTELLPIVYAQLQAMARRRLAPRDRRPVTLDTGALVHEVYLKLFGAEVNRIDWKSRGHFYGVAALAMRQIVVDHARRMSAAKRGGAARPLPLDSSVLPIEEQAEQIIALNDALSSLARLDERLARVVDLRFFVGLSVEEVAQVIGTSERTIKRDWRKARALLYEAMSEGQ